MKSAVQSMVPNREASFCGASVDAGYVSKALNANKYDYIVVAVAEDGYKGFIVAYDVEDGVYLDVVCSLPGFGGPLIENFMNFVKKEMLGNLSLSSLINVLGLYPKYGFKFRKNCSGPIFDFKSTYPELWAAYSAKARQLSEIARERNRREGRNDITETMVAYDEPIMIDVMKILIGEGLMGDNNSDACKNRTLATLPRDALQKFLKDNDCGVDGFSMVDCHYLSYPRPMEFYQTWLRTIQTYGNDAPAMVLVPGYDITFPYGVVQLKAENYTSYTARERGVGRTRAALASEKRLLAALDDRSQVITRAASRVSGPRGVMALKATRAPRVAVNVKTGNPYSLRSRVM